MLLGVLKDQGWETLGKTKYLSAFERDMVVGSRCTDLSVSRTATLLGFSHSTQLSERKENAQGFHHDANGDFKTVAEFNSCDRRKCGWDQQHCIYSIILI